MLTSDEGDAATFTVTPSPHSFPSIIQLSKVSVNQGDRFANHARSSALFAEWIRSLLNSKTRIRMFVIQGISQPRLSIREPCCSSALLDTLFAEFKNKESECTGEKNIRGGEKKKLICPNKTGARRKGVNLIRLSANFGRLNHGQVTSYRNCVYCFQLCLLYSSTTARSTNTCQPP